MSTAISVLGGVGLFLLGMTVMTEGLKGLAGSTLRKVLGTPIGAAAKRTVHADASARVSRRRSGPRRYRSAPHANSGGRPAAEPPPGALIFLPLSTLVNSPTKSSKINCDLCQLSGRAFVAHKDEVYGVSTLRCDPYPGDGSGRLFPSKVSLNNSGPVHLRASSFRRQGSDRELP